MLLDFRRRHWLQLLDLQTRLGRSGSFLGSIIYCFERNHMIVYDRSAVLLIAGNCMRTPSISMPTPSVGMQVGNSEKALHCHTEFSN